MTQANYGCHNRAPFKATLQVQDGWAGVVLGDGTPSRAPAMKTVPFRNVPDCQYKDTDLGKADARCVGCCWRDVQEVTLA